MFRKKSLNSPCTWFSASTVRSLTRVRPDPATVFDKNNMYSRDMHFQKPWPFKCQMVGQSQACMPVDVPFAAQKTSYSTNVANDFFLRQRLHLRHQLALLFPPQRQLLGVGQLAGSLQARDEVGHFYPGGPGIATEEAKSKPSSWVYIMANTITISHTGFCTLFAHRWVREHLGGKQDCRNSKAV